MKTLETIERDENGWIEIKSEEDILIYNEEMWVTCNDGDILTLFATKNYLLKNCSHYQPIYYPKPPVKKC